MNYGKSLINRLIFQGLTWRIEVPEEVFAPILLPTLIRCLKVIFCMMPSACSMRWVKKNCVFQIDPLWWQCHLSANARQSRITCTPSHIRFWWKRHECAHRFLGKKIKINPCIILAKETLPCLAVIIKLRKWKFSCLVHNFHHMHF